MSSRAIHSHNLLRRFGTLGGAFLVLATLGCGKSGGGALATVDGDTITMDEFHKYLETKQKVQVIDGSGSAVDATVAQSLGYQAMNDLIQEKVIRHLAKDEGVYPSDTDIAAEIEFQSKKDPNFMARTNMLSSAQLKDQVGLKLAIQNLLTKGITVTKDEVDRYIKDNPTRFMEPGTADLEWVVVGNDGDKQKVDADLKSGKKFSEVAAEYSKAPNAAQLKGKFPQRNVSTFKPDLRALIEKTPELKATDWVKNGDLWAKWYVEKKVAAKPMPIDDSVREEIKRQLGVQRGSTANDLGKRINEKLVKSKIDVKSTTYKPLWEKAMAGMQPPPAQSGGAIPGDIQDTSPTSK